MKKKIFQNLWPRKYFRHYFIIFSFLIKTLLDQSIFLHEKDSLERALEILSEILINVDGAIYEKFIETQIKPYWREQTLLSMEELVEACILTHDTDKQSSTKYEYESLDEPVRPRTDRWSTNVCAVKVVDKIEFSDIDAESMYYKTESVISHRTGISHIANITMKSKHVTIKKITSKEGD